MALGVMLFVANHRGGPGTFLGFYGNIDMIGYDMATLTISVAAVALIGRGWRSKP